jgi:uncharacterized protein (DUF433 family)
MYAEAEAARLLGVSQGTLHYWLEGGVRRGRSYKPVLRVEPKGSRSVTWAEFVEAGLLKQYRRAHKVPMAELRTFIELLRERLGTPYPLAHSRPFIGDRKLVLEAQEEAGLDADFCLVAPVAGQLILTPPSDGYVNRVVWSEDIAAAWRPHDDLRSPVRMDPQRRFGRPAVGGVSTEVLWEQTEEGEYLDETADAFDLTVDEVRWAIAYENALRAA